MRKTRFGASIGTTGLSIALVLSSSLFPVGATPRANRIINPAAPGAIGIIEANGAVLINGREAKGSFTLWGDELVQASAGAKIIFGALGEVKLNPGGSLQLKMENAKIHEAAGTQAFSASLLAGEMNVKLLNESGALVNSAGSEFTASRGANFKVDLKSGHSVLQTGMGTVIANTYAAPIKTIENKTLTSTTTKKDAQFLSSKKLEKLIGSFQIKAPASVIAEAGRREKAMDELASKRATFMRSLSLTANGAFYSGGAAKFDNKFASTIGAAESLRGVLINGKLTAGREMLWGGEVLEAPKGSGARLSFSSIGQVVLNSGAKAKLTTETVGVHATDQSAQKVLAAQLLSGDLILKFDPNASGYVRAGDSVMAASRGAQFRVEMREGNGAVDVTNGSVMVVGNWPLLTTTMVRDATTGKARFETKSYNIRPASLNSIFQVGVNRTRNIQMLVTDEQNKPLADLPVRFTLKGAGSLGATMFSSNSIEVRTDAKGIATIPYNAGATTGTTPITAEVPGTNATATTTANVTRDEPGFFSWHGGFPAVVVASAAIGIGAGVWATKDKRSNVPIQGKGDAVLIP